MSFEAVLDAATNSPYGDLTVIENLRLQGAPLHNDQPEYLGGNPLDISVTRHNFEMMEYLFMHGCKDIRSLARALSFVDHSNRLAMFNRVWANGLRPTGRHHSGILLMAYNCADISLIDRLFELGKECPQLLKYPSSPISDRDINRLRRCIMTVTKENEVKEDLATCQVLMAIQSDFPCQRLIMKQSESLYHLFVTGIVHQLPEHQFGLLNFFQSWQIYRADNPQQSSILARLSKSDNLLQMCPINKPGEWNSKLDYSRNEMCKREKHRQFNKFCKLFAPTTKLAFDFFDRLFSIYLLATWEHERTSTSLAVVGSTLLLNRQVGFSKMEWMLKTYHSKLTNCLNLSISVIGISRLITEFLYFIPKE